jgi:F-type H+-transporting ATPase subunit delta
MAEVATIARPYAEAAFDVASASGKLADWAQALATLAKVAANGEVTSLLGDPKVSRDQLTGLFASAVPAAGADGPLRNFVATLAANERLALLPAIAQQFEQLRAEREGYAEADVASAFPLAEADLARMVATLERHFKRKIKPSVRIQPDLIGGVVVRVGDDVIDSSVRGRLAKMSTVLQS